MGRYNSLFTGETPRRHNANYTVIAVQIPMPTSFLYFDMGNVLLSFSDERMCRQMAVAAGVSPAAVHAAVLGGLRTETLQWRFERGDLNALAVYEHLCENFGVRPDMDRLLAAGAEIFDEIPGTVAIVRKLVAAGRRLGIMSNTNPIDWSFVTARFPFLNDGFDEYVLSYQVRVMKPDRGIYDEAVRRAGVPAGDVFFADDRQDNVEGALAAGLDAVLFTTPGELEQQLKKRSVL